MLLNVLVANFFLPLNNVPLWRHTPIYPYIFQFMDIWVISSLELLFLKGHYEKSQLSLLNTYICFFFFFGQIPKSKLTTLYMFIYISIYLYL